MAARIIVLSGRVSAGKSTLSTALADRFGCVVVKTQELIRRALPNTPLERRALQEAGDRLDRRKTGDWVSAELSKVVQTHAAAAIVVVDAIRKRTQVAAIRRAFGARVIHIHLTAPIDVLAKRYSKRKGPVQELGSYKALSDNATERSIEDLADRADVLINTALCDVDDVVVRAAAHLGFYGRSYRPLVDVIVGGEFGSEGKGHIAAYLAPEYDVLVRVGGPNAGHTVFEDPPYTHHQLPSGTRRCEARLVIGPGASLDVAKLLKEIAECRVSADRLSIDPQAMVIEEYDKTFEMGKLRGAIGSTAQGGGAAASRRILRGAAGKVRLAQDVPELRPFVRLTQDVFDRAFCDGKRVLLEGTQGTGLSLYHGHYPHVTSRDTTVSGCLAEAGIAPSRVRRIVMVCRTYPIRVQGPSGPMGREISWTEVARRSGLSASRLRAAEKTSTTGRKRRVAEFNWALLRRAASLNGPTDIALTFADYIDRTNERARRFEQLSGNTIRFIEEVESIATTPVSLVSTRFDFRSIIDRRRW